MTIETTSEEWEAQEGWEKLVARSCIDFPLAPRDAKRLLEAVGALTAVGFSVDECLTALQNLDNFEQNKGLFTAQKPSPMSRIKP